MTILNSLLWNYYEIDFPLENDLCILVGDNGAEKHLS